MLVGQRQHHLVRQTQHTQALHQRRQGVVGHRRHAGQPADGRRRQATGRHIGRAHARSAAGIANEHMRLGQQHQRIDGQRQVGTRDAVTARTLGFPARQPVPVFIGAPAQTQRQRLADPGERRAGRRGRQRVFGTDEPAGTGMHQLLQRGGGGATAQRHRTTDAVQCERQQRRQQRFVGRPDVGRLGAQHVGDARRVRVMPADLAAAPRAAQVQLQRQPGLGAAQHVHQALVRCRGGFGRRGAVVVHASVGPAPRAAQAAEPGFQRVRQGGRCRHRPRLTGAIRPTGAGHRRQPRRRERRGGGRLGRDPIGVARPEPTRPRQRRLVGHQRGGHVLAVETHRAGAQAAQVQAGPRIDEEADRLLVDLGAAAAQAGVQPTAFLVLRQQRLLRLQPDGPHQREVIEVIAEVEVGGQ